MHEPKILEGAEEFTLGDGPTGALLIHGFTGSPQGLRTLGDYLAGRGIAVSGLRLPGHGTTWQDLNRYTAADWTRGVEAAWEDFAGDRDEIFIVALSFGAALAVDFIARHPDRVKGLVTLGGFIDTRDPRRHLAPILARLLKSLPGVGNDISDPSGREIAYDRLPTAAGYSMLGLLKKARAELASVECPILVMHGRNDHTVPPYNAQLIYDRVSSRTKQILWCERSFHVITLDYDRDEVFRRTYEFIKEHSRHAL